MSSIPSPREAAEIMSRVTAEGRKLTYELRVIQQPERARACGSGAKSSADRRPVDPPPVVELRIFEGENKSDITFSYNANFFLYASLELARPIAQGRVAPSTSQIPVLTGMPVSGMAYLDRPIEAGYFIFPDLSVRHEGKYRLQFNLYEETKDPKDFDPEEPKNEGAPPQNACFNWRLEVKSAPFTVYSAKKFPGLAESTVLSRTVAEQGCRVRIRRDVRMRRRDGKNSGEFEEDYEDFSSRQRTRTPEPSYSRVRSVSNASVERPDPYTAEQSRRPSAVDYPPQSYQSNYAQSSAPPQTGSATSYLTFGAGSAAPQYQAPSQYAQPPAPVQPIQPSQQYQPAQVTYDQGPPGPPQYRQGSISGPSHSNYTERPPYQQYASTAPAPREPYDQERRSSVGFVRASPSSSHSNSHYNNAESTFRNPPASYQSYSSQKASTPNLAPLVNLAPLKMFPLEPRYEPISSPPVPLSGNRMAAPLPSPFEPHSSRSNSYSAYPSTLTTPATEAPRSGKRTFETVFSNTAYNQPLHNGMRPSSSHHNGPSPAGSFDDDDDGPSMEELRMQYKRADGSSHARALPNLQ